MNIYYCDHFVLPLPSEHRFPMPKYRLLRERVQAELVPPAQLLEPDPATDAQMLRVHSLEYFNNVKNGTLTAKEVRRIGFPWSNFLLERSRRSVGGTIAACRQALVTGISVNLAGGTHHAYADHGEGYCVFNDAAIAARALQTERLAPRIVIIDCDVHQGNGTAAIFAHDDSVFTFSIHGAKNYPFHKEPSDLDIALADGTNDQVYLEQLDIGLQQALGQANADMMIYLAGADPFVSDRLGRLSLTKAGLAQRDQLVFDWADRYSLPVAVVMAGGYAPDVTDIVDIHFQTIQAGAIRLT